MSKLANRMIIVMILVIMISFIGYIIISNVSFLLPISSNELIVNYSEDGEEIQIYIGKEKSIITNLIISEEENKIVLMLEGKYFPNSTGKEGVAKDKISIKGKDRIVARSIFGEKEIYAL